MIARIFEGHKRHAVPRNPPPGGAVVACYMRSALFAMSGIEGLETRNPIDERPELFRRAIREA